MRMLTIAALLVLTMAPALRAEKYALLIGVGRYQARTIPALEGPVSDVEAMRGELVKNWGFARANIVEMVDTGATREAVLAALSRFVGQLKAGDTGFLYFSGHGTSAFDKGLRDRASVFSPESGALVPFDARIGTLRDVSDSLIIGNRDIRPRLAAVHPQATVLVAFDSCYSGSSARNLMALPTRGLPVTDLVSKTVSDADLDAFGAAPAASGTSASGAAASGTAAKPIERTGWPYANVLYISAAAKMEKAIDISSGILRQHPTVDGNPHGAMTNHLLGGMGGLADTNHDGTITYEELYRYTSQRVEMEFNHKPQFESPGPSYSQRDLFGQKRAPSAIVTPAGSSATRVRLEGVDASLQGRIAQLPGVRLAEGGAFDLLLRPSREGAGYDLFHSSYDRIQRFEPAHTAELLQRIGHHGDASRLVNLAIPKQAFNVDLQLRRVDGASGEATFYLKDHVRMVVTAERPAYLMAFNIDTLGNTTLLHAGGNPVAAGKPVALEPALEVVGPLGTEYVKLIAFATKPAGWEVWAAKGTMAPGSEDFAGLLRFLSATGGAQTTTKLVTTRKP